AADQRAARLAAARGDAGDHRAPGLDRELPGRVVVEEEQRLGALDDQIVDAHRDEIDADAVVAAALDRGLWIGARAVGGGEQQRIAESRGAQVEQRAEAAEFGVGAGPPRRLGERLDRLDQRL